MAVVAEMLLSHPFEMLCSYAISFPRLLSRNLTPPVVASRRTNQISLQLLVFFNLVVVHASPLTLVPEGWMSMWTDNSWPSWIFMTWNHVSTLSMLEGCCLLFQRSYADSDKPSDDGRS